MKIDFIGTGMMGSLKRGNSSILINDEILFDIGSGVLLKLKEMEKDISKIKYIIITHFHADHFLDIACFLLMRYIRKEQKELTLIGPKGLRQKIIDLMYFTHGDNEPNKYEKIEEKYNLVFKEVEEENVKFDDFEIQALSLIHSTCTPCNGYILNIDGKTIGYTGDTTECESLEKLIKESRHIFIDTTVMNTTKSHIGLSRILEYAKEYSDKTFYLIHRSDAIKKIEQENVIFPEDGDAVKINW